MGFQRLYNLAKSKHIETEGKRHIPNKKEIIYQFSRHIANIS